MFSHRQLFDQRPHPADVDEIYHVLDVANIAAVHYWEFFFEEVRGLDFDSIVECGVGRGRSLMILLALNRLHSATGLWSTKRIIAFDSFKGFPAPTRFDDSEREPHEGDWATSPSGRYRYTPDFLNRVLERAGLESGASELLVVEGFFGETCYSTTTGRIGILHLDGDLYESTKGPLDALASRIVPGGVIVIDDFQLNDDSSSHESWPGCRRAVMEFVGRHPEFRLLESMRGTPYLQLSG